jgi:hypothetical protein
MYTEIALVFRLSFANRRESLMAIIHPAVLKLSSYSVILCECVSSYLISSSRTFLKCLIFSSLLKQYLGRVITVTVGRKLLEAERIPLAMTFEISILAKIKIKCWKLTKSQYALESGTLYNRIDANWFISFIQLC